MKKFHFLSLLSFLVLSASTAFGQLTINVATQAEFENALRDVTLAPDQAHTINITQNIDISASAGVSAISVDSGSVTINGGGNTITAGDGAGNGVRPFFIHTGTVTINNLTVDEGTAQGGTGSGGGLGAGGAVFVDTAGNLTINNVSFTNSTASGGAGGTNLGDGGGGLGGNGGSSPGNSSGGGGGGGLYGDGGDSNNSLGNSGGGGGGGAVGDGGSTTEDGGGGGGGLTGNGGDTNANGGGGGGGTINDGDPNTGNTGGDGGVANGGDGGGFSGAGPATDRIGAPGARGGGGGGAAVNNNAVIIATGGDGGSFGGGGGGGRTNGGGTLSDKSPGGSGGVFAGGGGGGGGLGNGGSSTGGSGGDFGGGGGVGQRPNNFSAGDGGFGGGGGSNAAGGDGGNGGFGAGGGAAGGTVGVSGFGASAATATQGGSGAGFGGAVFIRDGGTLTINGNSVIEDGEVIAGGVGASAAGGGFFLKNSQNLTFDNDAGETITIEDDIADSNGATGAGTVGPDIGGRFTKAGEGTLALNGDNTYAGGTALNAGRIEAGTDTALGTGTLDVGGTTSTIALADGIALGNGIALGADLTVDQDGGDSGQLSGVISGAGELAKTGADDLTLTGTNTYTGGTDVQAGTLTSGAAGALVDDTDYNVEAGATLELGGNDLTVSALTGAGEVATDAATLTADLVLNSTFDGEISGTGSLTKLGGGTLDLGGASTYSGGTILSAGELELDNDDALGTGTLTVDGAGTLTLEANATDVGNDIHMQNDLIVEVTNGASELSGDISGGEQLIKAGAETLTLTGTNSYTGGTDVQAGTLTSDSAGAFVDDTAYNIAGGATLDLNGNALTVSAITGTGEVATGGADLTTDLAVDSTFEGVISGTGGLVKQGTTSLELTGINTHTGDSTIEAGTLFVNGSAAASAFTVEDGGTLGGDGTVGATTIESGGTIAPGNSIGTTTVQGAFTQNAGSTYAVEIEPGGASDLILVNGTATINGGTVDVTGGGADGFSEGQRFTIVSATGGVIGVYDAVNDDIVFLDSNLIYTANDVILELARNGVEFPDVAQTPNQIAVSTNLQEFEGAADGDLLTLINGVLGLTEEEARDAFDALSGEIHGSLHTAQRQFSEAYLRQARNHLRKVASRQGGGNGIVQGQSDGFAVTQQAGMSFPDMGKSTRSPETDRWTGWIDGYGVEGGVEGEGNANGFDYQTGGSAFGFDLQYTESLALSVFGGYGKGNLNSDQSADNAEADNAQVSFGAVYSPGPFYLLGAAGYGYHDYDTERFINFGPINRVAEGDYDAHEAHGYLELGIEGDFGRWTVTPRLTAQYLYLNTEGFTETGAGAAGLTIGRDETSSLRAGAGLSVSRKIDLDRGGVLIPELSGHYYHEALDNSRPVVGSFGGSGGSTFTSQGASLGRDFVEAGVGFTFLGTQNLDLGFRYDIQFTDEHVAHQGSGGIQIRW